MNFFELNYPFDNRVNFYGSLPDLTSTIDLGNIWYDIRPLNNDKLKSIIYSIIHLISSKPQNHKCQIRNFTKIIYDYSQEYPILIILFALILEISLLGNYIYSIEKISFLKRIEIRDFFRDYYNIDLFKQSSLIMSPNDDMNNKQIEFLLKWMNENEQYVYYSTKEFYIFLCEYQYVIDKMLIETSNWLETKIIIKKSMDFIRNKLNNDVNFLHIMEDNIEIIQKFISFFKSKLKKFDFIDILTLG